MPRVLILGHSFVKRLYRDVCHRRIPRASLDFNLQNVANIFFHGIGGRTVAKLVKHDLDVVRRVRPQIVLLEIGTNDLALNIRPESVGSAIEELVNTLLTQFEVSVVCVCHVIPRGEFNVGALEFARNARMLCQYLEVVLEQIERVFCWRHTVFTAPSKDLYVDGVHPKLRCTVAIVAPYYKL